MKSKSRKSFGLIETLIACAILIMIAGAVLAINVILNNNLQFTRERAHAYYRAMETIEAVRITRDTNYVDGDDSTNWNSLVCNNASGTIQIPATDGTTKYYPNFNCNAPGMGGRFFLFPKPHYILYTHGMRYFWSIINVSDIVGIFSGDEK